MKKENFILILIIQLLFSTKLVEYSQGQEIRASPGGVIIHGQLHSRTGSYGEAIGDGYVFALSANRKQILGYSETLSGSVHNREALLRGGIWRIEGLPFNTDIVLVGFSKRVKRLVWIQTINTGTNRVIDLGIQNAYMHVPRTSPHVAGDINTAIIPGLQILFLAGYITDLVEGNRQTEMIDQLIEEILKMHSPATMNNLPALPAGTQSGDFITVARYSLDQSGVGGIVAASKIVSLFTASVFNEALEKIAAEILKSEVKNIVIKSVLSYMIDEEAKPRYMSISFPLNKKDKLMDTDDLLFLLEYPNQKYIPLGIPHTIYYLEKENSQNNGPVLGNFVSCAKKEMDESRYMYQTVNNIAQTAHTSSAPDKTFQTMGVVAMYKKYEGETLLILKEYQPYDHYIASGTMLKFLAVKMPSRATQVPAPGSVVHICGETRNLRNINPGWRLEIDHTPWYSEKTAKYIEPHIFKLISGVNQPISGIIYDRSIFYLSFTEGIYQALVTNLSMDNTDQKVSYISQTQSMPVKENQNKGVFTDARDGKKYPWVKIGTQIWMAENLAWLPSVVGPGTGSETTPYHYVYDYNGNTVNAAKGTSNYQTYGALYNWPAALSACPAGWHLPTDAEWTTLDNYLIAKGYNYDGTTTGNKIAKSLATASGWFSHTGVGTVGNTEFPEKRNATGFSALPSGLRYHNGTFRDAGFSGCWWSSTKDNSSSAWTRFLGSSSSDLYRSNAPNIFGFGVRCLRDN